MKKLLYLLLLLPAMALAQSTDQNYVKSIVYKQPSSTELPANPTAAQANVNVTYFDGLGRPMQQVAHKQSGTGGDIVTPIVYDKFGRQTHDYLPLPISNPSLDYRNNQQLLDTGNLYYGTNFPQDMQYLFSQKRIEASPLNRVLEQGAPGAVWAVDSLSDADHTIKFGYHTNTADDAVKLFKATATWNSTSLIYTIALVNGTGTTFYSANQLYKTVTRDENWKPIPSIQTKLSTTEEFKNKKGQVVLKRTYNMVDNNVKPHDTYYVYDQFDNLTYVVPPLATGSITAKLDGLCYQYRYDHRNRLVEKKLPGKQWEFIVYDKLDRVVATGPAYSPFSNVTASGWLTTKYDAFNRPILTAWKQATFTSSSTRKVLQELYNGAAVMSENRAPAETTINGVAFKYTNLVEPKAAYHILTINYYDDYDFTTNTDWMPTALPTVSLGDSIHYNRTIKPKGLATGSWVRILEASSNYRNQRSYMLYDKKARPVFTFTRNHLLGYDFNYTKYDFEGKVLQTRIWHFRLTSSYPITSNDFFTYTDQGRLLEHRHKVNTDAEELLARNIYDDLGQLKSRRVGGPATGQGYQNVDYSYNIRGWLTGINDVGTLAKQGDPLDLFGFKLNYNTVENSVGNAVEVLYNGNISETFWRTGSDNTLRKYGYVYDGLNRLTEAIYQKPISGNPSAGLTNSYNEEISYDRNGNILRLSRNGYVDEGTPYMIDNLAYTYVGNSNRLNYVVDETNSFNGFKDGENPDPEKPDYDYDLNGNMTQDWNKGIWSIAYNHLNLPTRIVFDKDGLKTIDYLYNALGVKIGKSVTDKTVVPNVYQQTDYLGGFQYIDNTLAFFPTAEGYVSVTAGKFKYVYNYTDHLGNIRLSYSRPEQNSPLVIMEESHYYPFGMKHSNYAGEKYKYVKEAGSDGFVVLEAVERSDYQYKYNGKEFQDELSLNLYDYGARNYDPAIGRWMNIDPLAEIYRRHTPYAYAVNNPVYFTDPDGMGAGDYYSKAGEYLGTDNVDDNKVYVADSQNKDGTFNNAKEIEGVTHDEFATASNVVKHESSGNKDESLWIAHTANNAKDNNAIDYKKKNSTLEDQLTDKQYSTTPASARTALATTDKSKNANNARAAVIDVLTGGADPTGGAVLWDGTDFLTRGSSHNKFKEFRCVDIDAGSMSTYSSANSKAKANSTFTNAINNSASFSGSGKNGKSYSVESTGAKGKSLFWKLVKN